MSGTVNGLPFPPAGRSVLTRTIPSYIYEQYNDDAALVTFATAFNVCSQEWIDWFAQIDLPVYSGLTGGLLDWIGAGVYGYPRPTLTTEMVVDVGGYATAPYNTLAYNEAEELSSTTFIAVSDDVYCRMLTWHTYKGDGFQFNTRWLKQRIHRFLNGAYGVLAINDTTEDVAITESPGAFFISIPDSAIAQIFQIAVDDERLALPFQFSYTVSLV